MTTVFYCPFCDAEIHRQRDRIYRQDWGSMSYEKIHDEAARFVRLRAELCEAACEAHLRATHRIRWAIYKVIGVPALRPRRVLRRTT